MPMRAMWRVLLRVRSRPKTAAATLLVLIGTALLIGTLGYFFYQWRAAQEALADGRPKEARRRLDFCLFIWPRSSDLHLLAARASWLSGDFEAAEAHLKQCLRLQNGASAASQLEFLLMRARTGEEDEVAPILFTRVDNQHPDTPLILETLASAYMHRLRYGLAYDCLSRWIKEAPGAAKPFHWRGWVLERLNNHQSALDDYQRALELDRKLVPVRLRIAEMLLGRNQPYEALAHLELLSKQCPDRPEVAARLGHCRLLQGQAKEARLLLETAEKNLPDDAPLLLHLAQLELEEGRPIMAEPWVRRALKADPADTVAQYTLFSSLQLQGRKHEAAAALLQFKKHKALLERSNRLLRDLARRPSKDPSVSSEIGALLLDIGQERLGLYWLDQALLLDPRHQTSHQVLADYFDKKGEVKKAAAHRRRLAEPGRKVAARP